MIQLPPELGEQLRGYFKDRRELANHLAENSSRADAWELATLYASASIPCERCGGDPGQGIPGTGFVERWTQRAPVDDPAVRRLVLALMGFELGPPLGDVECPDCRGRGVLEQHRAESLLASEDDGSLNPPYITAQPTGSSRDPGTGGGGHQLDALEAREVSDWLWSASTDDPGVGATLEAWYSKGGGELRSLWHLTQAGRELLRRSRARQPSAGFWNRLLDAQAKNPDPSVADLLAAADRQAEKRLERATLRYLKAVRGEL